MTFGARTITSVALLATAISAACSGAAGGSATGGEVPAAPPTFSPPAGTVAAGTTLTVTCATAGTTPACSTDGSAPAHACPATITAAGTVTATCSGAGHATSAVAGATYTLWTPPVSGAPRVLYTDILSGPTTGGENGDGIYLSIFGVGFGASGLGTGVRVYIGGAEAARYVSLGPSRGRPDVSQITVQVGALDGPVQGTALPIRVAVNGVDSNTDLTFTPNPGRVLFVDNVSGDDSTAVPGDVSHPYRHVQTGDVYAGGAWGAARPGDFIVMRGRSPWTDVGFEGYFVRYRNKSGSAPTGAAGTGPIAIMGYPGEDVFLHGTLAAGMTGGCISAINGQSFAGMGQWAVVTNLRIDCEGYDGPVSQEVWGHHWRVVNNELSASTAPTSGPDVPRMAGITGNGDGSVWLGNHIHDIQGSWDECHGLYIDGDGTYEIAWNDIHDIRSGNGFQVYVNGGNGSDVADDVHFHHNRIHGVSKHGINIADASRNGFVIHDNVVYDTDRAGIRFNTTDLHGALIFNNTFADTVTGGNEVVGVVSDDWGLPAGALNMQNNIFCARSTATAYFGGSEGLPVGAGTVSHNLYCGGAGSTAPDTSPVTGTVRFVAAASGDYRLAAGSAGIDQGSSAVSGVVTDDFTALTARPRGSGYDVGAYEREP
jgi:hypothetical protein